MPGVIANLPKFQFSANGAPMVGGTLTAYIAGTSTPTTTWQDSALSIANTNPVTLDSRGECVLWLNPATVYKFVLKNAQGVVQWTQDQISNPAALSNALRAELAATTGASGIGGAAQAVGSISALRALLKTNASKNAFVAGYYAAGDGGGGAYYCDAADATTTDNGGSVIVAADGGRWKLARTAQVSVRQFGAKGDGVADDALALQACLSWAALVGAAPYLPPGNYRYTVGLVIAGTTTTPFAPRASLLGESTTTTRLLYAGDPAQAALTVSGNTTGSGPLLRTTVAGFRLEQATGTQLGDGLRLVNASTVLVQDVLVHGFNTGISLTDALELEFERVTTSYCNGGVTAARGTWTNPNMIRWSKCAFVGHNLHGVRVDRPANWVFDTCVFTDIGTSRADYTSSSVLLLGGPTEGGAGATFINGYFESNRVAQDVYAYSNDQEMTVSFIGTTFQNVDAVKYAKSHIKGESGARKLTLSMVGPAFKNFNGYVPAVDQPCIATVGARVAVCGHDSIAFGATVTRPSYLGGAVDKSGFSVPYARASINADGTVRAMWGLASVAKTATGVYRLTYSNALPSPIVLAGITGSGTFGVGAVTAEAFGYTDITMRNQAGNAADLAFGVEIVGAEA